MHRAGKALKALKLGSEAAAFWKDGEAWEVEFSEACHVSFKCKLLQFCFDMMKWEFQRTQLRRKIKEESWAKGTLRPHGLQHARLPCPSPAPGACWNSCPSSWWCHPTILSSVIPFFSCLQSFIITLFFSSYRPGILRKLIVYPIVAKKNHLEVLLPTWHLIIRRMLF